MTQSRKKAILGEVQKQRRRRAIATVIVVAVLIAIISGGVYAFLLRSTSSSGLPDYLDLCVSGAGQFYHAHAHLSITISGSTVTIPGDVGREGSCLRPLHTHSTDGVIHVEPDRQSHPDYSLGDFFLIWGVINPAARVFNSTYILGHTTDAVNSITLTVNGVQNTAFQNYLLPRNACWPAELPQGQTCDPGTQVDISITYGPATPS